MLKILLILVGILLIYFIIKKLKNKSNIEMFSTNEPTPLVLKVIADDYLGIYHEKNPVSVKLSDEMIRTEEIDSKYSNNKKIMSNNGVWLSHGNLPKACCNKIIDITIPDFKSNDRLLFFVGNTGGPGYVAGQIEYNGRTYQTDAFNEDIWNCIGVLPGLSVKGFDTSDLSNEFPTEGKPYLGNMAKPITGSCSGNIHFTEFMTNLAKFLHKYDKSNTINSSDIINRTEEVIKKYGYGTDDCRNLDKDTWLAGIENINTKNMGCFTNDLALYNNKIFFGWYRDDIKDSDLEEALARFYGKISNMPQIISFIIQVFGLNLKDSKVFDNENSTQKYDVDEYYEKLALLIGLDPKDKNTMSQMLPILEPTKCNPLNIEEEIDFYWKKDISKEFREKYKSNPFWYKSGKKLGCFSDASTCITTRLTDTLEGSNYTEEQCRNKAMKRGDKFYGLQEKGICKTSGSNSNNYENLNFTNPAQECISDNQCNTKNSATWGQVVGSTGNNLVYSNESAPKLVNASTINEFNSVISNQFDQQGEKCNLLTTEPEMLGNASFRGNEFYGYLVIEFKPKTNSSKFCPDPNYNEWNPKGCSLRTDKTSCSTTAINYGNSIRFIPDDTLCRTRYEKIKPVSIVSGGKVNNPLVVGNNTNVNTNFIGFFNKCISNIRKSIINNAPQTNTKGNISMNEVEDFIKVLYDISKNSQSILNETDVWDGSKSDILKFVSEQTSNLSLLTNKIKRAYERWSIINLENNTDDGQGEGGTSSVGKNKSDISEETINGFETNYNILSEKIRIISNLCVCSDNKCDNICGIEIVPEPKQEIYHRLSVSKPIKHMNQNVKCQLRRGQYLGNSRYKAVWNCGAIKSIPMKFRVWDPNVKGKPARSMKINVYQSKHGVYRYKMEPVIFAEYILGNSERNCKKAATHYGIIPGKSWGCADQLTKSWWSGKDSQKQGRGPNIRNGPGCTSSAIPNTRSGNYKRECRRLKFIQGTGKTSVNDEEWWKVNTQNGLIPKNFWAFRADSWSTRPDGASLLYISQYGSNKNVRRYKFSWGRACCGWSPYFCLWVYKNKKNIPLKLQSKAQQFYVSQSFQPYHRFAVSTRSINAGWSNVFQFWAFSSNPGDIQNDKLGRCEADCDTDADCKNGMVCHQRNGYDIIPGCLPGGKGDVSGGDYCIPRENIYKGNATPGKIYQSDSTDKVFLKIRQRNRQGRIQNRMCNLDQRSAVNSNNRSEVIWNCNEDGGKSISLDENSREIKATLDGKTCKLDHNPAQKGIVDAEWDCSQPPLGSIKINKKK